MRYLQPANYELIKKVIYNGKGLSSYRQKENGRKQCFAFQEATKRIFALNLKTKKFWSEEEQRFVTLKVSCKGMRIIEKNGLDATIKDAQNKGFINLV